MKIVIDISVLGESHYTSTSRTGIFRYIENVTEDLVNKGIDIIFSAGPNGYSYFRCLEYLKTNSKLATIELIKPDMNSLIFNIFEYSNNLKGRDLFTRIQRVFFRYLFNIVSDSIIINKNKISYYDVYHAMFSPAPNCIKSIRNIRIVQTVYDLIPLKFPEYCTKGSVKLIRKMVESIDSNYVIITISDCTKKDLLSVKKINPSNIFVTPLAASSNFYQSQDLNRIKQVRNKLNIPTGDYILSLATLEPRKNIISVIRAFDKLISRFGYEDLYLVLAGTKGWNYDEIFNHLKTNPETSNRIIITGFVDDIDLSPLYSGASLFIYPSHYEGFGLPPLEAMKCGVPVITSNNSSLPEVVGDAAIQVDSHDIEALLDAMHQVQSNPIIKSEMSKKSLQRASLFSWERCGELTVQAYSSANQYN